MRQKCKTVQKTKKVDRFYITNKEGKWFYYSQNQLTYTRTAHGGTRPIDGVLWVKDKYRATHTTEGSAESNMNFLKTFQPEKGPFTKVKA